MEDSVALLRRWALPCGVIVILMGIVFVTFSPLGRVREIRVKRTDVRLDVESIERSLAPFFGRHLFFLSTHETATLLYDAVPDLDRVDIVKEYPSLLEVRLTLQPLVARLSIEGMELQEQSGASLPPMNSYAYLTDHGLTVMLALQEPGLHLPLISVVDGGARPLPGTLLLSPSFMHTMDQAEQAVSQEFGLNVEGRTVFLRAREFHLKTPTVSLWFDVKSPLTDQLARLRTYLHAVAPNTAREYIDLRISGRVIYK